MTTRVTQSWKIADNRRPIGTQNRNDTPWRNPRNITSKRKLLSQKSHGPSVKYLINYQEFGKKLIFIEGM